VTDIVEELRLLQSGAQWACGQTAATLEQAADEIERLRDELINTRLERDNARRLVEAAWREGIAAAATELRAIAARLRRMDLVDLQVLANAATLEQAADALAELPAARKLTGLEYRGG
jgi:hypothetical protein